MQLGAEIVARFHGAQAGPAAQAAFIAQFSRGALPADIPTIKIGVPSGEGLAIARALKVAGLVSSNAEGNRMIDQRAVSVDQERIDDSDLLRQEGRKSLLKVGPLREA